MHSMGINQNAFEIRAYVCSSKAYSRAEILNELRTILRQNHPCAEVKASKPKIGIYKFILEVETLLLDNKPMKAKIWIPRIGFALKLALKNPSLFIGLILNTWEIQINLKNYKNGTLSSLCQEKFWWAPSGVKCGFPVTTDSHNHGLDPMRNHELNYFVFNILGDCQHGIFQEFNIASGDSSYPASLIGSWKESHFYLATEARLINGEALILENQVVPFLTDFETKFMRISRQFSSIWMSAAKPQMNVAKPWMDKVRITGISVLVDTDSNFYHFVSEGLRTLIHCLEQKISIQSILIREGLPESFYKLIERISPGVKVVRLKLGSDVVLESLVYSVLGKNFSSSDSNFNKLDGGEKFRETDEFRTWTFLRQEFLRTSVNYPVSKVLYIPRPLNQSRGILFERHILKEIKKSGGTLVEFRGTLHESYFLQLIEAKILVTSDGAGAANLTLLPPGSIFIELGNNSPGWKNLADAMEINYRFIPSWNLFPSFIRAKLDFTIYRKGRLLSAIRDLE